MAKRKNNSQTQQNSTLKKGQQGSGAGKIAKKLGIQYTPPTIDIIDTPVGKGKINKNLKETSKWVSFLYMKVPAVDRKVVRHRFEDFADIAQ